MIAAVPPKPACGGKHGRLPKADRKPYIRRASQTLGRGEPVPGSWACWRLSRLLPGMEACIITTGWTRRVLLYSSERWVDYPVTD